MGMFDAFIEESDEQIETAPSRPVGEYEQKLEQLLQLILRERDCARNLDMSSLNQVSAAKEALVRELGTFDGSGLVNSELAERVREENRRNAYLFWAGLGLVRDTMDFFGRQVPPPAYSAFGSMVQSRSGTSLLSGRI